jgi:hypothetical protein
MSEVPNSMAHPTKPKSKSPFDFTPRPLLLSYIIAGAVGLTLQPFAYDPRALLAIGRPLFGPGQFGHVGVLNAERVLDDLARPPSSQLIACSKRLVIVGLASLV